MNEEEAEPFHLDVHDMRIIRHSVSNNLLRVLETARLFPEKSAGRTVYLEIAAANEVTLKKLEQVKK